MSNKLQRHITATIGEYSIPPVDDMLVLGKNAAIGCIAMRRALEFLVVAPYEHIELQNDEVISDILVRKSLLLRLPREELIEFTLQRIKPLLGLEEILHVDLEVDIHISESRKAT